MGCRASRSNRDRYEMQSDFLQKPVASRPKTNNKKENADRLSQKVENNSKRTLQNAINRRKPKPMQSSPELSVAETSEDPLFTKSAKHRSRRHMSEGSAAGLPFHATDTDYRKLHKLELAARQQQSNSAVHQTRRGSAADNKRIQDMFTTQKAPTTSSSNSPLDGTSTLVESIASNQTTDGASPPASRPCSNYSLITTSQHGHCMDMHNAEQSEEITIQVRAPTPVPSCDDGRLSPVSTEKLNKNAEHHSSSRVRHLSVHDVVDVEKSLQQRVVSYPCCSEQLSVEQLGDDQRGSDVESVSSGSRWARSRRDSWEDSGFASVSSTDLELIDLSDSEDDEVPVFFVYASR